MQVSVELEAFFLPAEIGSRFTLFHRVRGSDARGGILYIHPFAEEMNKSRRMAALQARAFAAVGWDVLSVDLMGCGDSDGDFGDATLDAWLQDVDAAHRWLATRGSGPVWLWGLRL